MTDKVLTVAAGVLAVGLAGTAAFLEFGSEDGVDPGMVVVARQQATNFFSLDHRRADGEHRARRYLDLHDAPLDGADDLRVLVQELGGRIRLPPGIVEREFRLLYFVLALGLEVGLV